MRPSYSRLQNLEGDPAQQMCMSQGSCGLQAAEGKGAAETWKTQSRRLVAWETQQATPWAAAACIRTLYSQARRHLPCRCPPKE